MRPQDRYDCTEDTVADRRNRTAGRTLLVVLLCGGAGLALLACVGCGIVGYFRFAAASPIVGQYQLTDQAFLASRATVEFRAGGTGSIHGHMLDVDFDYTFTNDPPRLEWRIKRTGKFTIRPNANLDLKVNNVPLVSAPVERFRVILLQDGMILTNENGGPPLTLRRVR